MVPLVIAALAVTVWAAPAHGGLETSDDELISQGSVLTQADVPAGFEQFADDDAPEPDRGASCKAVTRASEALNAAPNTEASFAQGRDALINNQVSVFEDARQAKAAFVAYANKKAPRCFRDGFEETYAARLSESGKVDVTVDRYQPDLGDTSVGYEVEIALSDQGESQTLFANLEVVRVGRAIDAFAFISADEPLSSDDIVSMTEAGVTRLEDAL
jgi:hypothetical protein